MSAIDPLNISSASTGKIHSRSLSYRNASQKELLETVELQLREEAACPDISVAIVAHMDLADMALKNDMTINSPSSVQHHINEAFLLYSLLEDLDLRAKYLIRLIKLSSQQYLKEKEIQSLKLELQRPETIDVRLYKETELSIALSFHMELADRALNKNIKQTSEEVAKYHIEKAWEFYNCLSDPELRQEYRMKLGKLYIKLYKKEDKSELSEKSYLQLIEDTENDTISVAISAHMELANRKLKSDEEESYQYSAQYHIKKAIDICNQDMINSEHKKEYLDKVHFLLIELLEKSKNKYDTVDWSLNIYMSYWEKAIDKDSSNTDIYIRQSMHLLACAREYEGKQDHVSRLEYFVVQNNEQAKLKGVIDACLQEAHNIIRNANSFYELKTALPYIKQASKSCEEVDSERRRADYHKRLTTLAMELKQKKAEFASQKSKVTMSSSASTNRMSQFSPKPKDGVGNSSEVKSNSLSGFLFGNKK